MKYFAVILTVIGLLSCAPHFQDECPSHPRLLADLPQILNYTEGIEEVYREFEPGEEKLQIVRQFHFTGWPDRGVPADKVSIYSVLALVGSYDPGDPIVVHCSDGVGRTGALIFMYSILFGSWMKDIFRGNATVDFSKRLNHMRTLRPDVVNNKEQYLFVYQAVIDMFDPEMKEKVQEVREEYENKEKYGYI